MFTVSKQRTDQRWDNVLTPSLREALFSDVNGDFVWNLCHDNHLTDEKSYQVAELAGYVLYGFIHPEDLSAELVKSINLPAPLAKTMSDAINSRIFMPLKADLDKVYSPLIGSAVPLAPMTPKIVQGVGAAPKPTILSDVGWSKAPASAPIAPRVPTPAPMPTPTSMPVTPPRPPAPTPSPMAAAPAKPTEPAPVILHEDTGFKAVEKNAGFTLSRTAAGAEVHMGPSTVPVPPRSAVLEFGGVKPPATPAPTSNPGFKPPLSAMPTANAGPRNVSQITPPAAPLPFAAQKPPTPPAPPTPPQPPQAPQGGKPIIKDFL